MALRDTFNVAGTKVRLDKLLPVPFLICVAPGSQLGFWRRYDRFRSSHALPSDGVVGLSSFFCSPSLTAIIQGR
jgi:hypothetical protein